MAFAYVHEMSTVTEDMVGLALHMAESAGGHAVVAHDGGLVYFIVSEEPMFRTLIEDTICEYLRDSGYSNKDQDSVLSSLRGPFSLDDFAKIGDHGIYDFLNS